MFLVVNRDISRVIDCDPHELYQFRVYVGEHDIQTHTRASYWYVQDDRVISITGRGDRIGSCEMCVEIFGYTPEDRTSTFGRLTDLPYINGCSTKQLINPVRTGDPTFQMLYMPVGTSEQAHHIHSTPRVVYVARGQGISVVGTADRNTRHELNRGDVIVLGKMMPHHFETTDQDLLVLPVHVFSSNAQQDFDHPMFNGTHRV